MPCGGGFDRPPRMGEGGIGGEWFAWDLRGTVYRERIDGGTRQADALVHISV